MGTLGLVRDIFLRSAEPDKKTLTLTLTPRVLALVAGGIAVALFVGFLLTYRAPAPPEPLQIMVTGKEASLSLLAFTVENLGSSSIVLQSIYLDGRLVLGSIVASGGLRITPDQERDFSVALVPPLEAAGEHEVRLVFETGDSYTFKLSAS